MMTVPKARLRFHPHPRKELRERPPPDTLDPQQIPHTAEWPLLSSFHDVGGALGTNPGQLHQQKGRCGVQIDRRRRSLGVRRSEAE
jgi:hypothetical protein